MDHHCDLNTEIANYAKSCEGLAFRATQQAEHIEAKRPTEYGGGERARDAEVAVKRQEAARWSARAKVANEGFVLVDQADSRFCLDYSALIGRASRAHRARFEQTLGHGGMERAGQLPEQRR